MFLIALVSDHEALFNHFLVYRERRLYILQELHLDLQKAQLCGRDRCFITT